MKETGRKIIEIIFVIFIVGLSVIIFLLRDEISNIGSAGYFGVFLLCFLANVTVLLPSPSLMLAASCALIMNPWGVAFCAALGSSAGEFTGYILGRMSKDLSFKLKKFLEKLAGKIHNPSILVFILAALPLPIFDIIGIYSGGTKMNFIKFFVSCFLGKFVKMCVYVRMYDILDWATSLVLGLEGVQ